MRLMRPDFHSRRAFLHRSGQLAVTGCALPLALNLAAIGEAAAFSATDYKALVCVFLSGGNDYANTVAAYDDLNYDRYSAIRGGGPARTAGGLALAKAALAPTLLVPTTALPQGRQFAFNPTMTGLASLFNAGKAAVQLNVGPLVVPLTRAQYAGTDRKSFPLPPKLFSHNDQTSVWQSSAGEGSTIGWGGNMADLALASNGQATFTCISTVGNAVFLSGDQALQYQIGSNGAVPIEPIKQNLLGSVAVQNALRTLITERRAHLLENEHNLVCARSITAEGLLTAALSNVRLSTIFPAGNWLADQMKIVARVIAARGSLGARRQVFLVSLGGFDLHENLIGQHGDLMDKVSGAMTAFHAATVEMGLSDKVTAFTASEFGRTLTQNFTGTDHGWGGHQIVVGGAVKGKAFYGTPAPISTGNTSAPEDQWHVGQGRLLPTTSVDQYAATLAKWFGVSDSELPGVLPNIGNFGRGAGALEYPVDMGFMS